jgi:hypothetical protein
MYVCTYPVMELGVGVEEGEIKATEWFLQACLSVCVFVCVCVCVRYIYVFVCIYIYIYTHMNTYLSVCALHAYIHTCIPEQAACKSTGIYRHVP